MPTETGSPRVIWTSLACLGLAACSPAGIGVGGETGGDSETAFAAQESGELSCVGPLLDGLVAVEPAIGDIDGDGRPEIAVRRGEDVELYGLAL